MYQSTETFTTPAPVIQERDPYGPLLEKLKAHPRRWRLDQRGRLRTGGHCPVSAALGSKSYFANPVLGGNLLGLTPTEAFNVVFAADNNSIHDPALRNRLLAVTLFNQPPSFMERIKNFFGRRTRAVTV